VPDRPAGDLRWHRPEDSFDFTKVLRGQQGKTPVREFLLHQTNRLALAIRRGRWKFLDHRGSGGNDYQRRAGLRELALPDSDPQAPGQLYDLVADPGETRNLYRQHPKIVNELKAALEDFRTRGRSRQ
jgi:hypothetical protein